MEKKVLELEAKLDGLIEKMDKLTDAQKESTKQTEKQGEALQGMTNKLDAMTGGAITLWRSFVSGVKSGIAAMRTLTGAIAATGIGALLIAVTSLTAMFTKSEKGQERWNRIASVTGSIVNNLVDVLVSLGEKLLWAFDNPLDALKEFGQLLLDQVVNRIVGLFELLPKVGEAIKLAFTGNFKEAGVVVADAMGKIVLGVENYTEKADAAIKKAKEFGQEMMEDADKAAKVADMRNKALRMEREIMVERAEAETKLAELRLKAEDRLNYTAAQRKEAIQEALELQDGMFGKEQEMMRLRYEAQALENTLASSTQEDLMEEARLKADLIRIDKTRLDGAREMTTKLAELNNQVLADLKETEGKATAAMLEAEQKAYEKMQSDIEQLVKWENEATDALMDAQDRELQAIQDKYYERIEMAKTLGGDVVAIEAAQAEETAAIKDKYRKQEVQLEQMKQQQIGGLVVGAMQLAANVAGDSIVLQKGVALAQATMDTWAAVNKAMAQGGLFGWATAALVAANGLMNVAKIKAVPTPKPAGALAGGANASVGGVPRPSVNLVAGAMNPLAGVANQLGQPVQAFAVAGQMTTQQNLNRRVDRTATFG